MSSSWRKRGIERSTIVTSAPRPTAILAACVPTTPPPSTVTRPAATPGTPPSNMPAPPSLRRIAWPAASIARRPATSLMGANRGRAPRSSVTVSYAMAVHPLAIRPFACSGSGARCRYVKSNWPGRSCTHSLGCGSLTLTIMSQPAKISCAVAAISAPAARYASSFAMMPAPAPDCTTT